MGARSARASEIADRINKARGGKGVSVRGLYKLVRDHMEATVGDPYGASYGTIQNYTTAAVYKPRRDILVAIAHVLSVRADWLINGEGYRTDQDEERALAQAEEVEWLGDDWGMMADQYHRIRQSCILPNMTPPVRSVFWEAYRRLCESSVPDGLDAYDIAQMIDNWVRAPLDWLNDLDHTEPQVLNYYIGALNTLAILGSKAPRGSVSAILPTPKEQE